MPKAYICILKLKRLYMLPLKKPAVGHALGYTTQNIWRSMIANVTIFTMLSVSEMKIPTIAVFWAYNIVRLRAFHCSHSLGYVFWNQT